MYYVIEEASEALEMASEDLQEAINFTKNKAGKYLVKNDSDYIVYDSKPGISYKL